MRALAFNPDDALPKSFDIDRVEVLRGPQGTLFGAGSEGGTVRYITTPPSLAKTSIYARSELSFTQGGEPSYEAGIAAGGPIIDDTLGARATVWYRRDGGWIDRVDPTAADPQHAVVDRTPTMARPCWCGSRVCGSRATVWTVTPSHLLPEPPGARHQQLLADLLQPGQRPIHQRRSRRRHVTPDKFYLPALKIEGDFDAFHVISNTSYYHRQEQTGYDGTLYNLGFYQTFSYRGLPGSGPADRRQRHSPARRHRQLPLAGHRR